MQLNPEQQAVFQYFMAKDDLKPGECLIPCPFCQYFEVRASCLQEMLAGGLLATNAACQRVSCVHCKKEVIYIPESGVFAEGEEELEQDMMKHIKCAELAVLREQFEDARIKGEQGACPQCGLNGQKDNACTHMRCPSCSQVWCYFCGLKEENVDCDRAAVENGTDVIYAHNIDWQTNPNRCPWFFHEIHQTDPNWPEDEVACLNKFHKIRAVRELRRLRNE
ncbi:unnamed protein product, partial [Heterosigma akashiwo]